MYIRKSLAVIITASILFWSGICLAADSSSDNQSLELSVKEFHINYQEAIGDREDGWVTGFRIAYKNQNPNNNTYWRILYEDTNGNDHYNGQYQNGTPAQTTTNNSKKTTEIIFANPIGGSTHAYAYIGLGSYSWDRNTTGSGGYLEKYSWTYIPVGYRNEYKINDQWNGAVDIAVRFQCDPKMTAYNVPLTRTTFFDSTTFKLGSRPGLKMEFPFTDKINSQWSMVVSPWYEFWGIKQSNETTMTYQGIPVAPYMEPDSHTNQYGVDIGVTYNF